MPLEPKEGEYKDPLHKKGDKKNINRSTQIVCPNCGKRVEAENMELSDRLAKCGTCHSVFSFKNELDDLLKTQTTSLEIATPQKGIKPRVGNQKDVDIHEYKGQLSVDIIDYTDITALTAGIFSLFMLPIGIGVMTDGGTKAVFIIGLFLLITSIIKLIKYRENKSFIDVDDTYLRISSTQSFFYRPKDYLRANVRQIYTKSNASSGGPYFNVFMIYDGPEGEEHVKISPMTLSRSRALYIEQSLETFLGIEDKIVAEETSFK